MIDLYFLSKTILLLVVSVNIVVIIYWFYFFNKNTINKLANKKKQLNKPVESETIRALRDIGSETTKHLNSKIFLIATIIPAVIVILIQNIIEYHTYKPFIYNNSIVYSSKSVISVKEEKPVFITEANTILAVTFYKLAEEEVVTVTIAPVGENSSVHTVFSGYTEEFVSSAGVFLVKILDVDFYRRDINVQITRKS